MLIVATVQRRGGKHQFRSLCCAHRRLPDWPGRALVRALATGLSAIILGLGFLMVAFRKDKRGLHDLICDTKVIRRRGSTFLIGPHSCFFHARAFWLWFFLRQDKIRPEPHRLIAITFLLGCISTIPAAIGNFVFGADSLLEGSPALLSVVTAMTFVVGPVEELCKFGAVRLGPYRSLYFDEAVDGLVYAFAASLGFASLENLFYVFQYGPEVMLLRAPLSTVGHLVFGSIWGNALGHYYISDGRTAIVSIRFSRLGGWSPCPVQRSSLFFSFGCRSPDYLRRNLELSSHSPWPERLSLSISPKLSSCMLRQLRRVHDHVQPFLYQVRRSPTFRLGHHFLQ